MSLVTLKELLAIIIVVLALVELLSMGQIRGYIHFLPVKPKQLLRIHRLGGRTILVVLLVTVGIGWLGVLFWGYPLYSPRWLAHMVLGDLAALILCAKFLIVHRFRKYARRNGTLGVTAGLLLLGGAVFSLVGNLLGWQ
jgi:hypothetical protein